MKRRALLTTLGTLGVGATAGCLATGREDTPDDTTTTTPPEATIIDSKAIGNRETVVFPDNNRPHQIRTINRSDAEQSATLVVKQDGTTITERSNSINPGEGVELRLVEPGTYTVLVRLGGVTAGTIEVPRDRFDCNQSTTEAIITADGTVTTKTWSTLMGCPGPAIATSTIDRTGSECATQQSGTATVTVDGDTVTIDGTALAPNPCYQIGFQSVTLDAGTLTVIVEPVPPDGDGVCIECVGELSYEAGITLEKAYPDEVVVKHVHNDETRTVTTAQL